MEARLPEELLSAAISRLPAPRPPAPPSNKGLFLRLSDSARPVLLPGGLTSMWLHRETGAKCYMLSARALHIVWGDTPQYWRWIPLGDSSPSRFSEGAELKAVCWLAISGRISSMMLSQQSTYAAYMVFKIDDESYGLDYPPQEASIRVGESASTRIVCLDDYGSEDEDGNDELPPGENIPVPQRRSDGWMELEMGEFYNEEGEGGEVCISLTETKGGNWKQGLIVQGIEIRTKKQD